MLRSASSTLASMSRRSPGSLRLTPAADFPQLRISRRTDLTFTSLGAVLSCSISWIVVMKTTRVSYPRDSKEIWEVGSWVRVINIFCV